MFRLIAKRRVISLPSDPIGPQILLQIALILMNGFFAAAEIAIISVNDNKLKVQSADGDKKAIKILRITQNPTVFLSTIQVGITLGSLLASAFAADSFALRITDFFIEKQIAAGMSRTAIHSMSLIAVTVVLSFFMLVFGELIPKRIAMQKAEGIARAICGVISAMTKIMRPAIFLLSKTTNGMLRLFRIDPFAQDTEVSEEEILYMVDVADEKGAIGRSEKEMIENIFELNNMTAEDVMVHRTDVEFLESDAKQEDVLELIRQTAYSRFPVIGEDHDDILGILISRDFLLNLQAKDPLPLAKLIRPAYFVPESVRADILFKNMQASNAHLAVVVDEYGGTSGIITLEDLLEEIVGNIYDESDKFDEDEITPLADGTWRVSGSVDLETLSEYLDLPLPDDEEYDTLGGLIINVLSMIPTDGSKPVVTAFGAQFQVEDVKERRIEWVVVSKLPQNSGENNGEA
ncbi:MAG: hemolysin family protein [Eubacteriaceae bacterium]|jgi:putative hemolysin|nr:hemolysin family protein [Eubacteriaceae bacterium]